jgi:predicted amidohydrolase YtcJ
MLAAAGLLALTIGAVAAAPMDPAAGAADWVFSGGVVYTVDPARPRAEAVAVRGDTIVYVGDRAGAEAWIGKDTRQVDLSGRMLLPGFVDAHDHLSSLGATKLGVNVRSIKGKEAILERVRSWVEQQPEDAVLRGHGWSMESFGDVSPRREWLDTVTGDRPMYVLSFDMHDLWFNTAAMRLAGVSAATPDLSKTQYYERDADGTPSGHCHEDANLQILLAMGFSAPETIRESQKLTIDSAPSHGITTFMEAGVLMGPTNHESEWVYRELIERGIAGVTFRSGSWARYGPAPCAMILARWPRSSASGISGCGRTTCRSASASSGATGCSSAAARSRSRPTATIRSPMAA